MAVAEAVEAVEGMEDSVANLAKDIYYRQNIHLGRPHMLENRPYNMAPDTY